MEAFDTTPRLCVLSPEKGSGKTRVLEVLQLVCPAAELVLNISPAALFRLIGAGPITLLMDEADTYLETKVAKEHEDVRSSSIGSTDRSTPRACCRLMNVPNEQNTPARPTSPGWL